MVNPIPKDYPRVTPYLIVDGASVAIDFYTSVLGATERMRMGGSGGSQRPRDGEDRFDK